MIPREGGRTSANAEPGQQILVHSDSKVTQRYAHLSSKFLQDAANSASVIIEKGMRPAI
jgi:hypothetical protein